MPSTVPPSGLAQCDQKSMASSVGSAPYSSHSSTLSPRTIESRIWRICAPLLPALRREIARSAVIVVLKLGLLGVFRAHPFPLISVPVVPANWERYEKENHRRGRTQPCFVPPPGWRTTGSATHTHRRGSGSGLRSAWGWLRCERIVARERGAGAPPRAIRWRWCPCSPRAPGAWCLPCSPGQRCAPWRWQRSSGRCAGHRLRR